MALHEHLTFDELAALVQISDGRTWVFPKQREPVRSHLIKLAKQGYVQMSDGHACWRSFTISELGRLALAGL